MSIILDLILVGIIAISIFFAIRKGFIGTLISLIGTIVAISLSLILSGPVSNFIDNMFVNNPVKSYVLGVVDSSSSGKKYEEALNSIDVSKSIQSMPDGLKSVLELAGLKPDDMIEEAENATQKTNNVKDGLINKIASPISKTISTVIAVVLLFLLLSIGIWFLSKLITAVISALPLGKTLNKSLGFIFGLVRGLAIVFVISVFFVTLSKAVKPESNNIFSKKTINSTFVLKTVSSFNPIEAVLNIK